MKSMKVLKSLLVVGLLCSMNGMVAKAEEDNQKQVEMLSTSKETVKVATGNDVGEGKEVDDILKETVNIIYLDSTNEQNGDGTEQNPYNNFNDAMRNVKDGGTIKLLSDLEREFISYDDAKTNGFLIKKDITLDLNENTIYAYGDFAWYGLKIDDNVDVVIQNGKINSTAKKSPSNASLVLGSGAKLEIYNCEILGMNNASTVKLNSNSSLFAENSSFFSATESLNNITGEANSIHLKNCVVDGTDVKTNYYGIDVIAENMVFENCIVSAPVGKKAYELTVTNGSNAIVSGGEINGVIRTGWKSNGTLIISGDTVVNGQVIHVGNGTNNTASYIEIEGGRYELEENLISTSLKENISVSGGKYKNQEVIKDFIKEPYQLIENIDDDKDKYPYTILGIEEGAVASVGTKTYTTLEEAMAEAEDQTIRLLTDVETDSLFGNINGSGKKITYTGTLADLTRNNVRIFNANLKCKDAEISNASLQDGCFVAGTVIKGGIIPFLENNYFISDTTNSIQESINFEATIGKIGYEALINALSVAARTEEKEMVILQKNKITGHEEIYQNANYTLDLNGHSLGKFIIVPINQYIPNNIDITIIDSSNSKAGKIISDDNFAVATNGALENIKLTLDGVSLESKETAGIYFPSSGVLTIKNSNIVGTSGIELRGGDLYIENTNITATATEFRENPNTNGTTVEGGAIVISQHTTNHPIKVNIQSGMFKGIKAFYEVDLQDENSDNIEFEIYDGTFDGEIYSENIKKFITGGKYSETLSNEYIAEGYELKSNGTVGQIKKEPTTPPSRPSGGGSSSTSVPNSSATTESGNKVKVETVKTDEVVNETLGKENVITSIQVEKAKENIEVTVQAGKKLTNQTVYVVQQNADTGAIELVAVSVADEKGKAVFTTDSTEVLTVTTSLPEGFISTAGEENKATYYVNEEGNFQKGWLESESGDWYYFDEENGQMLRERWGASATDWYFMGADGKMLTNAWVAASEGRWYYVGSDGAMVVNVMVDGCWINEEGIYYSPLYQA